MGNWKLRIFRNGKGKNATTSYELYDLDSDIGESNDLARGHPEVVQRRSDFARKYDDDLKANK